MAYQRQRQNAPDQERDTPPVEPTTVDPNSPPEIAKPALARMRERVTFTPLPQQVNVENGPTFLTARPQNGFHPVYGANSKWTWVGIPLPQRKVWLNEPSGKALITVHGCSAHPKEPKRVEILAFIPNIVNETFGIDSAKLAAPEIPFDDPGKPIAYLLYGLTDSIQEAMLFYGSFGFSKFQFTCHPLRGPIPHYLCTIKDFVTSFVKNEHDTRDLIRQYVWDPPFHNALLDVAFQIPELRDLPDNQAIKRMTKDLDIEIVWENAKGGNPKPIVNIICPPPTNDEPVWEEFRGIFMNTAFSNGLSGIGICDHTNRSCAHCHSLGHYQGLCPFTKVRNWPFNPNEDTAREANTPNNNGRQANNRGNGRGRGNRGRNNRGRN